MAFSKTVFALALAISGTMASAHESLAAGAPTTYAGVNLNVRIGPGKQFEVVDTLFPGETVQTRECRLDWCFITHEGPDGWVAAEYLSNTIAPAFPLNEPSHPIPIEPGPGGGPVFGPDSADNPWPVPTIPWPVPTIPWPFQPQPDQRAPDRPIPTEPQSQACFYVGNHYTGRSTCVISGRAFEQLGPRWNNQISSMRIYPGAQVTLCKEANYQGYCASFSQDVYSLDQRINSRSSSLRVD